MGFTACYFFCLAINSTEVMITDIANDNASKEITYLMPKLMYNMLLAEENNAPAKNTAAPRVKTGAIRRFIKPRTAPVTDAANAKTDKTTITAVAAT